MSQQDAYTQQQALQQEQGLPYDPTVPPNQFFSGRFSTQPWMPGGTAIQLCTIMNGTLYPLKFGAAPLVVPIHESPPSALYYFRFAPGTQARQFATTSWHCRKVVYSAPGTGFAAANSLSIWLGSNGVAPATSSSFEIPPGASGVVETNDIINLWWVGQNTTDIIQGYAESNL
jgi:hypothetical protein